MASLPAKVIYRVVHFGDLILNWLLLLPKLYLSAFVVRVLGGLMASQFESSPILKSEAKQRKILLLRYRYYLADKNQPSNEIGLLDNTLRASGHTNCEVLTYDSDLGISPYSDLQLIRKCAELRPSILVLSSWWFNPNHPSVNALRYVRRHLGIPIVAIWWDTCHDTFWPSIAPYVSDFDLHIVVENPRCYCLDKLHPLFDRFIPLWSPLDQDLFYTSTCLRDIPISFVGKATGFRSNRQEYIKYLLENGIAGHFAYADEVGQITHSEYADIIRRSRIGLNFSYSVDAHQLKGRVLEIMLCGTLLFESENDQTSMLFKPMEEYIPFSSKEDLLNKVNYFLGHPNEMNAIAFNGARKANQLYSSGVFWDKIFSRINQS